MHQLLAVQRGVSGVAMVMMVMAVPMMVGVRCTTMMVMTVRVNGVVFSVPVCKRHIGQARQQDGRSDKQAEDSMEDNAQHRGPFVRLFAVQNSRGVVRREDDAGKSGIYRCRSRPPCPAAPSRPRPRLMAGQRSHVQNRMGLLAAERLPA